MTRIVKFLKDLTVDCIDEDGHRDYRSYSGGVPANHILR